MPYCIHRSYIASRSHHLKIRDSFERFICHFLDAMQEELLFALPQQKWLSILNDKLYRQKIISRRMPCVYSSVLSSREAQCLSLIAEGLSTKEVAEHLFLSNETVSTHAKAIRQKMGCKNIAEAVAKAFRWGIL